MPTCVRRHFTLISESRLCNGDGNALSICFLWFVLTLIFMGRRKKREREKKKKQKAKHQTNKQTNKNREARNKNTQKLKHQQKQQKTLTNAYKSFRSQTIMDRPLAWHYSKPMYQFVIMHRHQQNFESKCRSYRIWQRRGVHSSCG